MADEITLRYWAAAKAAAGTASDQVPAEGPLTVSELLGRAVALHPGGRLADVLQVCAVLVDDRPVSSEDPGDVRVQPGQTVQFLPPFAGG